jgi:hypothetical protein
MRRKGSKTYLSSYRAARKQRAKLEAGFGYEHAILRTRIAIYRNTMRYTSMAQQMTI